MIFRRPLPAEAETFASLHVQCWKESYRGIVPDTLLDAAQPRDRYEMWHNIVVNPRRIVIGTWVEGVPAGFVVAGEPHQRILENEDGQLAALYILKRYHRMGIGSALVQQAAAQWRAMDGTSMSIGVLAANMNARAFYESLGAKLVRTGTYNWSGHEMPDCIYIWRDLAKIGKV
jgi:ribosomal protein S18 acetylase RimI-like enzyme